MESFLIDDLAVFIDDLAAFVLEVAIDGLILILVVPRSRVVAEMKPYAWAEVHGYAGTMVVSPIAYVVVLNVTTVVWPIAHVVLRHAASPVVIPAASAALRSFRDS